MQNLQSIFRNLDQEKSCSETFSKVRIKNCMTGSVSDIFMGSFKTLFFQICLMYVWFLVQFLGRWIILLTTPWSYFVNLHGCFTWNVCPVYEKFLKDKPFQKQGRISCREFIKTRWYSGCSILSCSGYTIYVKWKLSPAATREARQDESNLQV